MAAPQSGYPPHGQPGYDQHQLEEYDNNQQEHEENASAPQQATTAGGRKKRHYAGQAYDFGGGANSALGGQPLGGVSNPGPYPLPPGASNGPYPQHPQQSGYQQPSYGDDPASSRVPGYGQPPPGVGGYQAPDPGYPSQASPPNQPGVGGITQGMSNMGMGGQPHYQPQQMQQRPQLNQLFPTDLHNQPFNVAELNLPPPAIILPPNVRSILASSCQSINPW